MTGYVDSIIDKTYGFIYTDSGASYFFHKSDLTNCTIYQLEEGDVVEFTEIVGNEGKPAAAHVRKKYQAAAENIATHAGINPSVSLDHFNGDEQQIVRFLGKVFYVTSGGEEIRLRDSTYRYFLVKPTEFFNRTFQLNREIVVIFSDYVSFEPRSLDAASYVYTRVESKLRLDRGCHIFVSHDDLVASKLNSLLKDGNVNQIVIPFTYKELLDPKADGELVKERFREYLFDTDLFSVTTPIQSDVFFFGRRDYVHDIVSKCKNYTNSGIFGLRRSGKTSVLYAVQNLLRQQSYPTVFIPCESDLSDLDWRAALYKVVLDVYLAVGANPKNISLSDYQSSEATILFEKHMYECLKWISVPLTIMFDEIEAITFGVSQGEKSSNKWLDGDNFVHFWNALKGYYSKYPKQLSLLVAGTNPMINEIPVIGKTNLANPMFKQLSESNQGAYLPAFTTEDTKNMVNTLGGYMGISFDEYCINELTFDCGGHPYLMRILCGQINKYLRNSSIPRPVVVSKAIYDKAFTEFEKSAEASSFFLMVLNILMTSYPKEFNVLKYLALGNDEVVSKTQDKESLFHLIGYGLVDSNCGKYAIKFKTISVFLKGEYRFERQGLTIDEQREEIEARISRTEILLRQIIKNVLLMSFGTASAKNRVLSAMESDSAIAENDVQKARNLTLSELFDPSVNKIYFSLLEIIIEQNYSAFSNVFESVTKPQLETKLDCINKARRCPSHSYSDSSEKWTWQDFEDFREKISWLERVLKKFE